ncbi:MAG TPA: polyprenyl synthetase family protein [Fimbriimonas sp.]|nr:polyprenyl synthetase family protein [Fimbriimonas sp.]
MSVSSLEQLASGRVDAQLLAEISEEVGHVEEELHRQVGSRVETVRGVGRLTLRAGGKRLRPAFVTLAARATALPFDLSRTRRLGAGLEMIHMATLIHDDVIDHSTTRRGKPTAAAEFGNTAAILSGDVLLARAMRLLSEDGDLEVIQTVSQSVIEVAEGEVRELEVRGQFDLHEEDHLEILRLKTASFIQCCCEVGAILTKATPEVRNALSTYGHHVGMAFQIVDDLLDYRGDKATTGKPVATDFREAQATLPLIYLRPTLTSQESEMARMKFGNGVTDDEIRMMVQWMDCRGAFARAEALARNHLESALGQLEFLPQGSPRDLLAAVAEYVVCRHS